jgi:hypothetical protein
LQNLSGYANIYSGGLKMRNMRFKSIVVCVLAFGMIFTSGCIFDPKPDPNPVPPAPIEWKDRTDKEDVITNMLLAYEHRDKGHYNELLHENYIWYLQDRDAEKLNQESLDYAEDTDGTARIFNRAVLLELEIVKATWTEEEEIGGEACVGCWSTERIYFIQAQFPGNETIYTGHDHVKFVVVPVDEDGTTKYRIRWAYDIDKF